MTNSNKTNHVPLPRRRTFFSFERALELALDSVAWADVGLSVGGGPLGAAFADAGRSLVVVSLKVPAVWTPESALSFLLSTPV